jgi:hypothetical protein
MRELATSTVTVTASAQLVSAISAHFLVLLVCDERGLQAHPGRSMCRLKRVSGGYHVRFQWVRKQ